MANAGTSGAAIAASRASPVAKAPERKTREKGDFARDGEGDVDPPRQHLRRAARMQDKPPGGQAHGREEGIERRDVLRDQQAEVARHGEQKAGDEPVAARVGRQQPDRLPACQPPKKGGKGKEGARDIGQREFRAKQQPVEPNGRRDRVGERGQQRRKRRGRHQGAHGGPRIGDYRQDKQGQRQRRDEPERNSDHRYSSETMKRVQPSGLNGALARRPAAMTRPAVMAGGSVSIQPIRRFAAAPSGGSRNQARYRIGRK